MYIIIFIRSFMLSVHIGIRQYVSIWLKNEK